MNYKPRTRDRRRGFSLVEMLVVIAVIGIVSAIAVPSIGAIRDKAHTGKSKRNAQNFCSLYQAARSVGASFGSNDKATILNEMIAGKTGAELAGSKFQMSALSDEEKEATLDYCSYDADADLMHYYPAGGRNEVDSPPPAPEPLWTEFRSWPDAAAAQTDVDNLRGFPFFNHPTGHYSNALPWRVGEQKEDGQWPVEYFLED